MCSKKNVLSRDFPRDPRDPRDHKSDKTAFEREENGPKIVEKKVHMTSEQ